MYFVSTSPKLPTRDIHTNAITKKRQLTEPKVFSYPKQSNSWKKEKNYFALFVKPLPIYRRGKVEYQKDNDLVGKHNKLV